MNLIQENMNQEVSTCKNCENCQNKVKKDLPIKQIESDTCSDIRNHISPLTKVTER